MTSSLLNEIKIEIRSLLISSQNGLSEDELCRDYSLFNSQRLLPYEIFGYKTKTDFLNSLTDILYRSSDGYIYPIVDQSTEHIFKFVQQQRTNKKKKQKKTKQQEYKYIQQSKPTISFNKQKKAVPSIISSFQQMHSTVGANNIKNQGSLSRLKPTINEFAPKFERTHVTNELLQRLLIHFRQQQQEQK